MSKLIVLLDPPHGMDTPGKRSPDGTHREAQWGRMICEKLQRSLCYKGITCTLTNDTENEIGLSKRASFANDYPINPGQTKLLLSIHNDAKGMGDKWYDARGYKAYTSKGTTKSDAYVEVLLNQLAKDFPAFRQRNPSPIKKDWEENFTVLMGHGYSAILLEWLFQDNPEDVTILKDDQYNQRLVESITNALVTINESL